MAPGVFDFWKIILLLQKILSFLVRLGNADPDELNGRD